MDELTTCPSCGAEQPADSRFCIKCGADRNVASTPPSGTGHFRPVGSTRKQAVACTLCGDVNDGELFCRACGRARPEAGETRCERCGTVDDGSRFCRTCGAPGGRLIEGGPEPPEQGRRWLVIALAVAALLLAAGAVLAVALGAFSDSKSKPRATAPTTQAEPPPPPEEPPPTTGETTAPAEKPLGALRAIQMSALHAPGADDHCFGPAPRPGKPHVTLRLGGTYRENVSGKPASAAILICGKGGDPSYASGTYRFKKSALGKDTRLGKMTARFGIDESGGQVQAGAQVTLTVTYYDRNVCQSEPAAWEAPGTLSCDLSEVDRPADISRLKIRQVVEGAKAPDVWAGLMSLRVVLLGPSA